MNHARIGRRSAAVTLAVAALFGTAGGQTSRPASQPVTWDQRIDNALAQTGSVDDVVADLAKAPPDAPGTTAARVRVAIEQGDLSAAVGELKVAVAARPRDVPLLRQLAGLQEAVDLPAAATGTLSAALAASTDPAATSDVALRLATLAFDDGRPAEAAALLDRAAAADPAAATRAGVIAYLYGRYADAARHLNAGPSDDVALRLLEGNAALKAGDAPAAAAAFTRALDHAPKPADRLYAQERLVAATRLGGGLPRLADAWSADPHLPAERLLPLAAVLRELGRVPDLLAWWRGAAANPAWADTVLSDRFVREVLDAARSAGRTDDATAICRELLDRHPDDPQWLSATLRGLLSAGHADRADALLTARLDATAADPDGVRRLGKLAHALGRDDVAVAAARRLVTFGGTDAIAGDLLEASVVDRPGDRSQTDALLRHAAGLARRHPAGVAPVVDALEAADLNGDAIGLLQDDVRRAPTEDSLAHLASLLMAGHRPAEAMPILRQMMASGSSVSVRGQAGQRLIEAAAATHGLPALAADLRGRLAGGGGTEQDLSLLVDADLRLKDVAGAVAALTTTHLIGEPARLGQLAVLFLRTGQLARADAVLRRLVDADPSTAVETLERLATVAMARGKPNDAAAAIGRIQARAGGGPASSEMMAGVFDRLRRPDVAADAYRRALAINPANADDWLLWATAMAHSRRGPLAVGRLQVLCDQAGDSNLFATAVDGLLNLNATPAALRVARRDAVLRVAARPHEMMLYHVLSDLSDEMKDPAAAVRATDAGVSVGDEERSQHLSELMDLACQQGLVDTAVDCGRSLLALDDDFPPQLFLQLGEQLLVAGRQSDAERAFLRAADGSDPDLIAPRVSDLYDRYGYRTAARDALAAIADHHRLDPEYLENLAALDEVAGDFDAAFSGYMAATAIGVRVVGTDASKVDPTANGRSIWSNVFTGTTPQTAAFLRTAAGAVATARTADRRAAVVDLLRSNLDARVAAGGASPPPAVPILATALRRACVAFACPDVAQAADAAVIRRWPAAPFGRQAVEAWAAEGLVVRAARLAADHGLDPGPVVAAAAGPTTVPSAVSPSAAAAALPALLMAGRADDARALLAGVPMDRSAARRAGNGPPPVSTFVRAALALGDTEAAERWAAFWVGPPATDADGKPSARGQTGGLEESAQAMAAVWPLLDRDGRAVVLDRYVAQLGATADPQVRAANAVPALTAAAALGRPLPDGPVLAEAVLGVRPYGAAFNLRRVFPLVPVGDRPRLLSKAVAETPPDRRLSLLTGVVAQAVEPLDDATVAAIATAAGQAGPGQVLPWNDWCLNADQRPAVAVLADAVGRCAAPDDATALASVAAAYATAGDPARADAAAARAVAAVHAAAVRPAARRPSAGLDVLRVALTSMSVPAREAALAAADAADDPLAPRSELAWRRLLRALLLDATGHREAALPALRAAHAADPTDAPTTAAYLARLRDDGRAAEEVATFGPGPAASHALLDLYRWREVAARTDTASPLLGMAAQAASDDASGSAESLRVLVQGLRSSRRYLQMPVAPDAGGLAPPASPLDGLAAWPGSVDDLLQAVRIPPNGRYDPPQPWMAERLARAAADAGVRDRVLAVVAPAVAADALTRSERDLVADLAAVPGCRLPPAFLDALRPAALADPTGAELGRLADARAAQGAPLTGVARTWAWLASNRSTDGRPIPPSLFGPADEDKLVAWLAVVDPTAAEAELAVDRSAGRVRPRFCIVAADRARLAAERGDLAAYQARVDDLFRARMWHRTTLETEGQTGPAKTPLDLRSAVPDRCPDPHVRRGLLDVLERSLAGVDEREPSDTDVPRQLAALGSWADRQGDRERADDLLARARSVADRQGAGEHQLWVADLADQLGHHDVAATTERGLQDQGCLPAARIRRREQYTRLLRRQ